MAGTNEAIDSADNSKRGDGILTKRMDGVSVFRETLQEWSDNTSFHCIKYVFDYRTFIARRIFWLSVIIAACYVLINGYISQVNRYREFKTVTQDSYAFEDEIEFPSVTVCSYCEIQKNLMKDGMDRKIYDTMMSMESYNDIVNNIGEDAMKNFRYDRAMKAWTVSADRLFYECAWASSPINCTRYIKRRAFMNRYCFTFSHGEEELFKVITVGSSSGLFMNLFIDQDNCYGRNIIAAGVQVIIHDVNEEPNTYVGRSLSPGFLHNIAVTKNKKRMLPPPVKALGDTECIDTMDGGFKNVLKYFKHYSLRACEVECISITMNNTCGCTHVFDIEENCDLISILTCAMPTAYDFWTHYNDYISRCGCLMPCERTTYTTTISTAYIPNTLYKLPPKDGLVTEEQASNKTFIRENFLAVDIHFESKLTHVSEQILDFTGGDLAASMGGYIGLAIGASVMTFLELFEMFFSALVRYCLTIRRQC